MTWENHPSMIALGGRAKEINKNGGVPCPTCWIPGVEVEVVPYDVNLHLKPCPRGHSNTLVPGVVDKLVELAQVIAPTERAYNNPEGLAS